MSSQRSDVPEAVQPLIMPDLMAPAAPDVGREVVAGVVRLPGGDVAAGATVTLHRLQTGWPEWRRAGNPVPAITDERGRFRAKLLPGRRYSAWASASTGPDKLRVTSIVEGVAAGRPLKLVAATGRIRDHGSPVIAPAS